MGPWPEEEAHGCPYPSGKFDDEPGNQPVSNLEASLRIIGMAAPMYPAYINNIYIYI